MVKTVPFSLVFVVVWCAASANGQDDFIARGLSYVRASGQSWIDEQGCVSCHQVPSMIWAHEAAMQSGIDVPANQLAEWKAWSTDVVNFLKPTQKADCDREAAMKSNIDTMTALLLAIPVAENEAWRSEFANKLASEQADDGSWRACGQLPMQRRPELETQSTTTLWTTLALLIEGTLFDKVAAIRFSDRVSDATSTEWYAARLLVADQLGDSHVEDWQIRLLDQQNEDGGWGWKVGESSDALGTGYALYALAKAKAKSERLAAARGYLHRTQTEPGNWTVPGTKKSAKGKPTATANDWGTAWAVIALAEQRKSNSYDLHRVIPPTAVLKNETPGR